MLLKQGNFQPSRSGGASYDQCGNLQAWARNERIELEGAISPCSGTEHAISCWLSTVWKPRASCIRMSGSAERFSGSQLCMFKVKELY